MNSFGAFILGIFLGFVSGGMFATYEKEHYPVEHKSININVDSIATGTTELLSERREAYREWDSLIANNARIIENNFYDSIAERVARRLKCQKGD